MELLFTGANGFLGRHLGLAAAELDLRVTPWVRAGGPETAERSALDAAEHAALEDETAVRRALERRRPTALLHLAARADVGSCAADPAAAEHVNAAIPALLARAAAACGVRFIHVSTDMVFDGRSAPYTEQARAAPLSVYGRSKLAGERAVLESCPNALVTRLPLLFGEGLGLVRGASEGLRRALASGAPVLLFADERRSALHARDAARALLELACGTACGVLHVAARDAISRYELGRAIALRLDWPVERLRAAAQADMPSAEPRPADLELDVRAALALGLALPTVHESVERYGARPSSLGRAP